LPPQARRTRKTGEKKIPLKQTRQTTKLLKGILSMVTKPPELRSTQLYPDCGLLLLLRRQEETAQESEGMMPVHSAQAAKSKAKACALI
jgi:hypothetical protein